MNAILHRAMQCGLSLEDFEHMTLGMVVDYCTHCSNESMTEKDDRYATQADIDAF